MSDITDRIESEALKSLSTSNDGVSVTRRSSKDLIEAEQFRAANEAVNSTVARTGLRMQQIKPGGGAG